MCAPYVGNIYHQVIHVPLPGKHISLPLPRKHISLVICVSQGRGTHITRDICFPGRGTCITRNMCFLGKGTLITRDMCFLGKGTHITRDMCFLGKGTHITRDCVSWVGEYVSLVIRVSHVPFITFASE